MTDSKTQSVIDRLQAYKKQFDDLLNLLKELPLSRDDKIKAQQMLKTLKGSLKADSEAGNTNRGQQKMTQVEKQYFHPAVHQAHIEIYSRWNAVPNAKLRDELYGAQINITHMLSQLEE